MSDEVRPDRPEARLRPRARRLVSADQVYDLLAEDPEALEPGLRVAERGLAVSRSRRIELLLSGKSGRAVIVLAAAEPRDELPLEALDLGRAARRAAPLLQRVFPDLRFDLPPRIAIVAPPLSRRAAARVASLAPFELEAHEFRCVEMGGVRALLVERVVPARRRQRFRPALSADEVAKPASRRAASAAAPERLAPILEDLRARARERILRLSDSVVAEPIADDGERFRLGDHVIAEVRVAGENSLEVGSGEAAHAQPVFSNTELEDALSPVIRRFFALYRQRGVAGSAAPKAAAPAAGPVAAAATTVSAPTLPALPDLRPAALTREEIDEFYKDAEG